MTKLRDLHKKWSGDAAYLEALRAEVQEVETGSRISAARLCDEARERAVPKGTQVERLPNSARNVDDVTHRLHDGDVLCMATAGAAVHDKAGARIFWL